MRSGCVIWAQRATQAKRAAFFVGALLAAASCVEAMEVSSCRLK
jgi:hypothetical protein